MASFLPCQTQPFCQRAVLSAYANEPANPSPRPPLRLWALHSHLLVFCYSFLPRLLLVTMLVCYYVVQTLSKKRLPNKFENLGYNRTFLNCNFNVSAPSFFYSLTLHGPLLL